MKKITTIEEMHSIELGILAAFDDFCRNNNLKYSLSYGTLIGAIRHNGFIPWDDDVDVWMPRDDYNKLLRLYENNGKNSQYKIVNGTTTPTYYRAMSKLIDARTVLTEKKFEDGDIGVFIDIWPLDGLPSNKILRFLDGMIISAMNKFLMARLMNPEYLFGYKKFAHGMFQWINPKKLVELEDAFLNHVNHHKHEYVTCYTTVYKKDIISCDEMREISKHTFENREYLVYSKFDDILKRIYGDYMQLPPKSERGVRHPANVFWK